MKDQTAIMLDVPDVQSTLQFLFSLVINELERVCSLEGSQKDAATERKLSNPSLNRKLDTSKALL